MCFKVLGKEFMKCSICNSYHLLEKRVREELVQKKDGTLGYEEVIYFVCNNDYASIKDNNIS